MATSFSALGIAAIPEARAGSGKRAFQSRQCGKHCVSSPRTRRDVVSLGFLKQNAFAYPCKSTLAAGLHNDWLIGTSRLDGTCADSIDDEEEDERLLREAFAIKLGQDVLERLTTDSQILG
jgi:hypothetical protein